MALQSTTDQYEREQRLAALTVAAGHRAWRRLDPAALDATEARYRQSLLPVLVAAQEQSATDGAAYVARALAEQGIDVDPAGQVLPSSLAGQAADGRPLSSLLAEPVIRVKQDIGRGRGVQQALLAGRARLDRILVTEVADAGRVASGVGVAARPTVMYTRYATPPSCPRCVILAGRTYRYSQGFQRHPGCDCVMQPSTQRASEDLISDPREAFDRGQVRGLSRADTRAIGDGADMSQVVNAHRGMRTAAVHGRRLRVTSEGMTRRGFARQRVRQQGRQAVRLMPEEIYRIADSRAHAIELLRRNAYIL